MKKKISWGMILLTILFVAIMGWQTSQSAPAPEQNLVPTIAPSVALPPGFATLEPVATERLEPSSTDKWFHAWGPVLAVGLVILMLFGSNVSIIRGVK